MKFKIEIEYYPNKWMFTDNKPLHIGYVDIDIGLKSLDVNSDINDVNLKEALEDADYRGAIQPALRDTLTNFTKVQTHLLGMVFTRINVLSLIHQHFKEMEYKSCQQLTYNIIS